MIQDSFAYGHAQRNRDGEIVEFHSFGGQDQHAHERFDFLGGAADETLGSRLKQTRGAEKAIDRCAEVLEMIAGGSSTDEVISYLDEKVLPLAREVKPAGPGTGLAKPPPPGPEG